MCGEMTGLNIIATHDTPVTDSLSTSSHLPPIEDSKFVNPVMLPPGRAKLSKNLYIVGTVVGVILMQSDK